VEAGRWTIAALDIMRLFKRFNEVGVTVLIATHDHHLIDAAGARRIDLRDGQLAA
jgi:cell division transport system ATP-binding protein